MSELVFGLIVAICVIAVLWALLRPQRLYLSSVLIVLDAVMGYY